MVIILDQFFHRLVKICIIISIYGIFLLISLRQCTAHAQVVDSSFYRWTVYELQEDELSPKQCYMVSHPISTETSQLTRQKPYLMIARYQRQRNEEINVYGGFEYKMNSKVFVAVDDFQFSLLAGKDTAWAKSKNDDAEIIKAILNSSIVKIRSDSAVGNFAVDEYSLQGITKAYARMKEICK